MRKTLEELLKIKECEYLDFKNSMYKLFNSDNNKKTFEIMELLRDVLSLVNIVREEFRNYEESYIIIGVDENNEKYNGRHQNITFIQTQTILQHIQEYISPSLTIDFKEKYLSGDTSNILVSDHPQPNYDRILIFIIKREIGNVYEFKKKIGCRDIGFERIGASYTRCLSHKRRLTESERIKIRSQIGPNLVLEFENKSNELMFERSIKSILKSDVLTEKLQNVKNALKKELNEGVASIDKDELIEFESKTKNIFGIDVQVKRVSKSDWRKYDSEVDAYIDGLNYFLEKRNKFYEISNKIVKFNLNLVNNGPERVKDIITYIILPEKCKFLKETPEFKLIPPKPPKKPKDIIISSGLLIESLLEPMKGISKVIASIPFFNQSISPSLGLISDLNHNRVIETDRILRLKHKKLMHGHYLEINDIIIKVPINTNELKIKYQILIGKPSRIIEKELTLKIKYH